MNCATGVDQAEALMGRKLKYPRRALTNWSYSGGVLTSLNPES
jgi:hypothetical protein